MNRNDWTQYFTPEGIADQLVSAIRTEVAPRSVVDICAGTGNLLRAVTSRWPTVRVVGNDRYRRRRPPEADAWTSMDGRRFALQNLERRASFDLVVANPPFGEEHIRRANATDKQNEFVRLVRDRRIEFGMTAAAAALVGKRGVLATVLPETVITAERYLSLRTWLSRRFCCFDVQPIRRKQFAGKDLGLVMLTGYREHSGPCGTHLCNSRSDFQPVAFSSCRGSLRSSDLRSSGSLKVIHVGGAMDGSPIGVRYAEPSDVRPRVAGKLAFRDLLVARVGRNAGRTTVFRGKTGTLYSDCLFRVRALQVSLQRELERISISGFLEQELRNRIRGLGAKYLAKADVDEAVSRSLSRLGIELGHMASGLID